MCSYHCDFCSSPLAVYLVVVLKEAHGLDVLAAYRSCIALMRPALVEARAVDADLSNPLSSAERVAVSVCAPAEIGAAAKRERPRAE